MMLTYEGCCRPKLFPEKPKKNCRINAFKSMAVSRKHLERLQRVHSKQLTVTYHVISR